MALALKSVIVSFWLWYFFYRWGVLGASIAGAGLVPFGLTQKDVVNTGLWKNSKAFHNIPR